MLSEARVVEYQRLAAERRLAGDLGDAEQLYRRALALAERDLPADDLVTAQVCNNLGVVLEYTGGFQEAAALYERAHTVFVARLGGEHPEGATVLHNIGGLAHAAGRPGGENKPPARPSRSARPASASTIPTLPTAPLSRQAAGHRVVERLSHGSRPVREAAPRRGLTGYVGDRAAALARHARLGRVDIVHQRQTHEGTNA